jgi:hypothetical protein
MPPWDPCQLIGFLLCNIKDTKRSVIMDLMIFDWQQPLHYFLHLVFPALIAFLFFRKKWREVYIIFLLTMAVDLDHLLADPIYDSGRCSIGFHPLHSYIAIGAYVVMLFVPVLRIIAIGLLMHMATDGLDCLLHILRQE